MSSELAAQINVIKSDYMNDYATTFYNRYFNDWRLCLAVALLTVSSFPIKIFSVPGFEVTPALVLSPLCLLLFKRSDKVGWAVIAFMGFCGLLALVGDTGGEGRTRNLLGALSFSSGAPYVLVGAVIARSHLGLDRFAKILIPSAALILLILAIDAYRTNWNLVILSSYASESYSSPETSFVDSSFPFYGKFAVITLATISMFVGCVGLASAKAFSNTYQKYSVIIGCTGLIFVSYSLWARQVMIGIILFYIILLIISFKRREAWVSVIAFSLMCLVWTVSVNNNSIHLPGSSAISANAFGKYKLNRAIANIKNGDVDDLSTGRMAIYRDAISKIDSEVILKGCGFCNIRGVYGFDFSSLHNVALTALFKGGAFYALIYCGSAFSALILLWFFRRSFARDVLIAAIGSIAAQGLVNDTLFFQVVPALLFAITGYCVIHYHALRKTNMIPATKSLT